jgi:hypothetical protein
MLSRPLPDAIARAQVSTFLNNALVRDHRPRLRRTGVGPVRHRAGGLGFNLLQLPIRPGKLLTSCSPQHVALPRARRSLETSLAGEGESGCGWHLTIHSATAAFASYLSRSNLRIHASELTPRQRPLLILVRYELPLTPSVTPHYRPPTTLGQVRSATGTNCVWCPDGEVKYPAGNVVTGSCVSSVTTISANAWECGPGQRSNEGELAPQCEAARRALNRLHSCPSLRALTGLLCTRAGSSAPPCE